MAFDVASVSQLIQAVSALVSLVIMAWIAYIAHDFSRRTTRLQIDRDIGEQLMKNNFEIYSNPEVAELYRRTRHPKEEIDGLRLLAQARYRMAILYQIWRLDQERLMPDALNRFDFDGLVGLVVRTSPESYSRARVAEGFDPKFIEVLDEAIKRLGIKDKVGTFQSGT